jgi:hypothetical protein
MDLLGSLGTLATNLKNVTLPGVLAAAAFALLLWPPQPFDRIPTVVDNQPDIANLQLHAKEFANDSKASLGVYRDQSTPACIVKEGAESYTFLSIPSSFKDRAAVAVKNQLILDDTDRALLKCAEEEQSLQGVEDQVTANIGLLITTRTNERDGINGLYQKYILTLSPMQAEFERRLQDKECEIAELQAHLLNFQRIQKERARRVAELQRLEKEMQTRLGDAGRLRPIQRFDDVLSGLSAHIVGFLTLVFAWGLLIDPVNRALFSFVYENAFDKEWDSVRSERQSPGDDARERWVPEEHGSNRPFAEIKRIRQNRWLSLFVVLGCVAAAVAVVVLWGPSPVFRSTTTILSTNGASFATGDSPTFTARVIAAGSLNEPSGHVVFELDGADTEPFALENGMARFKADDLAPKGHAIIAKYIPGGAGCENCSSFQPSMSPRLEFVVLQLPADSKETKPKTGAQQSSRTTHDKSKEKYVGCSYPPDESTIASEAPRSTQNFVPDLSKPRLPPFGRDLLKCVIVMLLALIGDFFLPGVLRPLTPESKAQQEPMTRKKVSAFKRSMEGDPTAKLSCEQKLAKEWPKISQPQYAIGQGLMARSDFETLQNSYYSQSLISTGLMLPLLLLVFALLVTPQLGLGSAALYLVLGIGEVLLLITGVDRRHKYNAELDSLISSAFLKMCAQNEKSATDKSSKSVADQIAEALKAAKIVKLTNYEVEPGSAPTPPTGPEPAGGSSPGPTGPAPNTPPKSDKDALDAAKAAQDHEKLRDRIGKTEETKLKLRPTTPAAPPPAPAPSPASAPGRADTTQGAGSQGKPGGSSGDSGPK